MRIYEERRCNLHNKQQVRLQFPILHAVPMKEKKPIVMAIQFLASGPICRICTCQSQKLNKY